MGQARLGMRLISGPHHRITSLTPMCVLGNAENGRTNRLRSRCERKPPEGCTLAIAARSAIDVDDQDRPALPPKSDDFGYVSRTGRAEVPVLLPYLISHITAVLRFETRVPIHNVSNAPSKYSVLDSLDRRLAWISMSSPP